MCYLAFRIVRDLFIQAAFIACLCLCVKAYDNFPCSIFIGFEKLFEYLICPGTLPGSQFSSVIQSCPTFCHPMDCSMPGLPVHHQLPEFTQTHIHWVGDATQPSCPLSSPSPPAFYLSQHQVFTNDVALCIRWPNYWSFSFNINPSKEYSWLISFRIDWFNLLAVISSNITVQKHLFFGVQPSLWSNSLIHMWLLGKP